MDDRCPECGSVGVATDVEGVFICPEFGCSVLTFRRGRLVMRANGARL
jgi:hypothetical protein